MRKPLKFANSKTMAPRLVSKKGHLVDDISTGVHAWIPSFGMLTRHMQQDDASREEIGENFVSPTRNLPTKRRKNHLRSTIRKKPRKASAAERIAKSIEIIAEYFKTKPPCPVCRPRPTAPRFTIPECMKLLNKMSGIEGGSETWFFATELFVVPVHREIFLCLRSDEGRMAWLKYRMKENMNKKKMLVSEKMNKQMTSFYTPGQGPSVETSAKASICYSCATDLIVMMCCASIGAWYCLGKHS